MKRYLVFVLCVLASLQVLGQSSCKINHFYQQGTTTDITEVAYNAAFDMELLVVYNPQEQATDKLKVLVQLPVGDNSNVQAGINAFPIVISYQYLNYSTNVLEVELTGFSATQQSTFTINVYRARISAVSSCTPVANVCTSALQYYNSATGSFVDFPDNVFSKSIYGKHAVGSITTQLIHNQSYYSSTNDANSPIYVDMQVNSSSNTYVGSSILLHLNSNQIIKKVLVNNATEAQLITVGSVQYYSLPAYYSLIRIYFDLPENTNPATLSLTGQAIFEQCSSQSTSFPISPVNLSFAGKPDNALLAYPSIFVNYNYLNQSITLNNCNSDFNVNCNLDNSYNSEMNVQQPVVMTVDIGGKAKVSNIWFSSIATGYPDKVYIRICGNTNYETTPLSVVGGVYTVPSNIMIDKIRMEFLHVAPEISTVTLNCKNVSSGQCNGSTPTIVFKLLKNEQDYLTETIGFYTPPITNYLYYNYSQNLFAANQEVRPVYLFFPVNKTLETGDYLSYTLSDNMTFPENPDLQLSFTSASFQSVEAFNAQYFGANPITYEISTDRKTLLIKNITIKGALSDCSPINSTLFLRVTTKVISKPSSVSNANIFSIKNSAGSILSSTQFNWSVIVTQAVTNTVFFSCNNGATKTAGITIKKDDPFSVYYTLENTTLYKYDQQAFVFYCTLPANGVEPTIFLTKTSTNGTTTTSSIIAPGLYDADFAIGNLDDFASLTYSSSVISGTNILRVIIPSAIVDAYESLVLSLAYPDNLNLTSNSAVRFYAKIGTLVIPPQSSALIIGPRSDCDLVNCEECITSFSPTAGEEYILSAWVKESFTGNTPTAYKNAGIRVTFNDGAINTFPLFRPTGPIVDGWQRIEASFIVPEGAKNIHITLVNESPNTDVFFDDIRIHPYNSNMKSFVYNPSTQKLVAELDENNFATMYEYDDEGILIRVKKETERGVMTIKETRSNQSKIK